VAGLVAGWAAWIGEAFARFDGPVHRLRESAAGTGGGLVNSVPANLAAVDGPKLLCRPASECAGVDPAAATWWVLLPVLVVAGLAVAARTGWLAAGGLATASAASFAAPYLLLLDYTSPRFLLPAYALLAVPVAGLLVWLTGLAARRHPAGRAGHRGDPCGGHLRRLRRAGRAPPRAARREAALPGLGHRRGTAELPAQVPLAVGAQR
jgi:hypothetical protein